MTVYCILQNIYHCKAEAVVYNLFGALVCTAACCIGCASKIPDP